MKLQAITFVGILVLAAACRKDHMPPPPPEFTQEYTLSYNVTLDETEAHANFSYTEGSYRRTCLPEDYMVNCNNASCPEYINYWAMPSGPGQGQPCYYEAVYPGMIDLHFEFQKPSGETFRNSLLTASLATSVDFDTAFTTLSISNPISIPFSGGPAATGEFVTISMFQDYSHFAVKRAVTGDSVIHFTAADLASHNTGNVTMYIVRNFPSRALDQQDAPYGEKHFRVIAQRAITITN